MRLTIRSARPVARLLSLGCVALLPACGATGGAGAVPVTVQVPVATRTGSMSGVNMMVGSTGQKATISASRDTVWALLPGAYEALGVPLAFKQDAQFRLGNEQVKARRALNGVQMRTIVDCGSDLNGEKADTYDIKLSIETSVIAAGDATEITTIVSGIGRSPNFGNSEISCGTKGELERRILRHVRFQLGQFGK